MNEESAFYLPTTAEVARREETLEAESSPPFVHAAEHVSDATRLRVALFTNSVAVGGMEEHVELLSRHLNREHFEVFTICPSWPATNAFTASLAEVSDHAAVITPDRRHGVLGQIGETWRLFRQLRAWRIDVMHMHATAYHGQYTALFAARLAGVKHIFVTEHLAPDTTLPVGSQFFRNTFSRLIDGIVCVSQKNLESRQRFIYTPPDRTIVVNNGVDLDDFEPIADATLADLRERYNIPLDAKVVGTAVRFEPEKGLSFLLDALPAIKAACPQAILLMVGDGKLRGELEAHVARLGLADCVRFVGFQSDPRPYLGLMDVFVLPVPVGSMSIGLLEAMAMKRAVVITFGGKGEAVEHGTSGWCAEPRNPAAIAEAVVHILQNRDVQSAFGEAARQRIEQHFSAQQVTRTLEVLYAQAGTRSS